MATHYGIRIGSGDFITEHLHHPLTLDTAKTAASDLSTRTPGEVVEVVSRTDDNPAGGFEDVPARFKDGRPFPWLWAVSFTGELLAPDTERLTRHGWTYTRSGDVHTVTVGAEDVNAAVELVREALEGLAWDMTRWESVPAESD